MIAGWVSKSLRGDRNNRYFTKELDWKCTRFLPPTPTPHTNSLHLTQVPMLLLHTASLIATDLIPRMYIKVLYRNRAQKELRHKYMRSTTMSAVSCFAVECKTLILFSWNKTPFNFWYKINHDLFLITRFVSSDYKSNPDLFLMVYFKTLNINKCLVVW